ncbi:hypothetical protein HAX54_048774, partial [Datura stramonium]|nr:hypothetical protein [Datura stramonium]
CYTLLYDVRPCVMDEVLNREVKFLAVKLLPGAISLQQDNFHCGETTTVVKYRHSERPKQCAGSGSWHMDVLLNN